MTEAKIPDYTEIFVKIFSLSRDLRTLRKAFTQTAEDGRARKDKKFLEKWLAIKAKTIQEKPSRRDG